MGAGPPSAHRAALSWWHSAEVETDPAASRLFASPGFQTFCRYKAINIPRIRRLLSIDVENHQPVGQRCGADCVKGSHDAVPQTRRTMNVVLLVLIVSISIRVFLSCDLLISDILAEAAAFRNDSRAAKMFSPRRRAYSVSYYYSGVVANEAETLRFDRDCRSLSFVTSLGFHIPTGSRFDFGFGPANEAKLLSSGRLLRWFSRHWGYGR